MQHPSERPELAVSTLVVLLALADHSVEPEQEPSRLEVAKLELRLVVADADALRDLTGIEHVASDRDRARCLQAVSAPEERLRDLAELIERGSVRHV